MQRFPPILVLVLLAALGCTPRPTSGAQAIRATTLFGADSPPPPRVGELELVRAYELRSGDPDFGGISAARVDGATLYLLSDRSILFEVAWPASRTGRSFDLAVSTKRQLTNADGRPLDAETLELGRNGEVLVGDEAVGRIFTFAPGNISPKGRPLNLPQAFVEGGAFNLGLEAMAKLPAGGFLAMVEGAAAADGSHVAAVIDEGGTRMLAYRAGAGFEVTDADVAGGWLLVLERRLSLIGGWQGRIAAVPLDQLQADRLEPLVGRELARIAGPTLGENYEGLSAHVGPDDSIVLLVVSDSNFNPFQRTQLLELRWRPMSNRLRPRSSRVAQGSAA